MGDVLIRRMTAEDVKQVHAIETATFPKPWSEQDFMREVTTNHCARYMVAETEGKVVAFAGAWLILDEGHITNIAVLKEYRGQGIGRKVTEALLQYASNLGVQYMTLEVRRSNERAQNLYKSLGFIGLGWRKRYYEDNGEDALLMVCDHMPDADPDFTEAETVTE